MTRKSWIIIASSLLLLGLAGLAYLVLKPASQPDSQIRQARTAIDGSRFQIELESNETTGFSWVVENLPSQIVIEKQEYQASPSQAGQTGQAGLTNIQGRVKTAGTYTFLLVYKQDWQGGEQDQSYQVRLTMETNQIKELTLTHLSEK